MVGWWKGSRQRGGCALELSWQRCCAIDAAHDDESGDADGAGQDGYDEEKDRRTNARTALPQKSET